jgi:hypothetical protein
MFMRDAMTVGGNIRQMWNETVTMTPKGPDADEMLVFKGDHDNLAISLKDIRRSLEDLCRVGHIPIKELSGKHLEDFHHIVNVLRVAYPSPAYGPLFDVVHDTFKHHKTVKPGTVAAFFHGCFIDTNFRDMPSCSDTCAGSTPPPQGTPGWQSCDKLAILLDDQGILRTLNEPQSVDQAYVFIAENYHFDGFTNESITQLSSYGVKKVNLIKSSGQTYEYLTGDFVPLNQLPRRPVRTAPTSTVTVTPTNTNQTWSLVFFIFIIILVLIVVGWWSLRQ